MSATHVAASAGKSMGNCVATGHAADLAAALCAKQDCRSLELERRTGKRALTGIDLRSVPLREEMEME
jgi:hypothetical protein